MPKKAVLVCVPLLVVLGIAGQAQADPATCSAQAPAPACSRQSSLPTAGETAFLTDVRDQRVPVGDARLLAAGRGICQMLLKGGVPIKYVGPQLAAQLDITEEMAEDVVDAATAYVCPGAPLNE